MQSGVLQHQPVSKILETGYINVYSELNSKEQRALKYKRKYKSENPLWDETQVYLSEYFKANCVHNCRVLDAGCGNGNYIIDENRKAIAYAVGVDASDAAFRNNICLDEKVVGNLETLPFADNSFDAVLSLWVLEHLENPEKVFAEVYRVLKAGGLFLFATPNKNFIPLRLLRAVNSRKLSNCLNEHLFGRKEQDIFITYYRANSVGDIRNMIRDKFHAEVLRYNYDPSYLSFDDITYTLSNKAHAQLCKTGATGTVPHIVGVLRKI